MGTSLSFIKYNVKFDQLKYNAMQKNNHLKRDQQNTLNQPVFIHHHKKSQNNKWSKI